MLNLPIPEKSTADDPARPETETVDGEFGWVDDQCLSEAESSNGN